LDALVIGSNLSMNNGSTTLRNGLQLASGVTLNKGSQGFSFVGSQSFAPVSGTATITSRGGYTQAYNYGDVLTLGTGLTLQGYQSERKSVVYGLGVGINSFGTINANVPGQTLYVSGNFTNRGLVAVNGGDMYVYNGSACTN